MVQEERTTEPCRPESPVWPTRQRWQPAGAELPEAALHSCSPHTASFCVKTRSCSFSDPPAEQCKSSVLGGKKTSYFALFFIFVCILYNHYNTTLVYLRS